MSSTFPELFNGLNPLGGTYVEANYSEDLFLQVGDTVFETWPVAANQQIMVGTVMGLDEATGELVVCDDALGATAGSVPYGIAMHAYDTTVTGNTGGAAGSMAILVRTMGTLNANALTVGGTHTINTIRQALSLRGISIEDTYYTGAY